MEQTKTLRVSFSELAKSVSSEVKLEITGENINNNDVLSEAKELFDQAFKYAKDKTLEKSK